MLPFKKRRTVLIGTIVILALFAGLAFGFFWSKEGSTEGESFTYKYKAPTYGMVEAEQFVFKIEGTGKMRGMVCEGCLKKVGRALKKVPGVVRVICDLEEQEARVELEKGKSSVQELQKAIEGAQFKATLVSQ